MPRRISYEDDDGRIVADMSDLEPAPLLIPRFDRLRGRKETRPDFEDPGSGAEEGDSYRGFYQEPTVITKEERSAMIKGGLAAGLLIVGAVALAFGVFIFLLTRLAS